MKAVCAVFVADGGQIGSPDLEIGTPDFVFPSRARACAITYYICRGARFSFNTESPRHRERGVSSGDGSRMSKCAVFGACFLLQEG